MVAKIFVPASGKKSWYYHKVFFFSIIWFHQSSVCFCGELLQFCEKYLLKRRFCFKFLFLGKNSQKYEQIVTIAYNVKGCFRFDTFIFWISPNLAKYTYGLLLPLEQHHQIFKKKSAPKWWIFATKYIEKSILCTFKKMFLRNIFFLTKKKMMFLRDFSTIVWKKK
jgi:hypothetical protein